MEAGSRGESLRLVADRLLAEFTDPEAPDLPGIPSTAADLGDVSRILNADQEAVVARLRQALGRIAATLGARTEDPSVQTLGIALDGVEFVIRGELVDGNLGRVLELMPSFVFLVALSVSDQDRALSLSRRTAELIEEVRAETKMIPDETGRTDE